jgi:hypothetical protein
MPLRRMGPPLGTCVLVDDCDDSLPLSMLMSFFSSQYLKFKLNALLCVRVLIKSDGSQSPPFRFSDLSIVFFCSKERNV